MLIFNQYLRIPFLLIVLIVGGCTNDGGFTMSPTRLWLNWSQEPQPPSILEIRATLSQELAKRQNSDEVSRALAEMSGNDVLTIALTRVGSDCAHFLNRLRAAQAGSRFTSVGLSTSNALAVGIMGATAAAAPAIAIVGATLAAANGLHDGFDETILMTQYADRISELVSAEQATLRNTWDQQQPALTQTTTSARAIGLALAAEYAGTCNYSGIRRLLDRALRTGVVEALNQADAVTARGDQALVAAKIGIQRVLNGPVVTTELAARVFLAVQTPSRIQELFPDVTLRTQVQRALDNSDDRRALQTFLQQANQSADFQRAVAALPSKP